MYPHLFELNTGYDPMTIAYKAIILPIKLIEQLSSMLGSNQPPSTWQADALPTMS